MPNIKQILNSIFDYLFKNPINFTIYKNKKYQFYFILYFINN